MEFDREADRQGRATRRRTLGGLALAAVAFAAPWRARAAAHELRPWAAGRPTPPLSLVDLAGQRWNLAALRGQVVVLNFWASWCEPCREEMPSLQRLHARLAKRGVTVLTVNYREDVARIQRFLDVRPLQLPVLLDPDGEAAAAWTPRVFPTTVLVDRTGVARSTLLGPLDWAGDEAERLLRPLWTPTA